jgi:hypothetical protein
VLAGDSGGLAALLAILGALLAFFGFVAAALWCVLRFLLTCQVLASESGGGVQAIRRSGSLIAGRIGPGVLGWVKVRATVMVTVVAAVLFAVLFVSGIPALVVHGVYGNLLDPANATPSSVPEAVLVPAELFQVLVEAFVSPLYISFAGLFYVDMRVRRRAGPGVGAAAGGRVISAVWMAAAVALSALPQICNGGDAERTVLMNTGGGPTLADAVDALQRRAGVPLATGLDLTDGSLAPLVERLESFCSPASNQTARPAVSAAERERLKEILSRSEFARRSGDDRALARLAAVFSAWLESLFETASAESFSRATRVLVLALALAAALAIGLRLTRRRSVRRPEAEAQYASPLQLQSPDEHLHRAEASLAVDPRLAIREGLLALLSALERRALARPDRVKTNREVAGELAERGATPAVRDEVARLLRWYDGAY